MIYFTNETDKYFKPQILRLLSQIVTSKENTNHIRHDNFVKLKQLRDSVSLREIAWMLAITKKYSLDSVIWDDAALRRSVDTIQAELYHNIDPAITISHDIVTTIDQKNIWDYWINIEKIYDVWITYDNSTKHRVIHSIDFSINLSRNINSDSIYQHDHNLSIHTLKTNSKRTNADSQNIEKIKFSEFIELDINDSIEKYIPSLEYSVSLLNPSWGVPIIKIMLFMLYKGYKFEDITWGNICKFLREHTHDIPIEREPLEIRLQNTNDIVIFRIPKTKEQCGQFVSRAKKHFKFKRA